MSWLIHFADLADGSTLEFRDRREVIGEDRQGRRHYRLIPARVTRMAREWGESPNTLYGFDDELGFVKITRTINYKANPSRHECGSACRNARGRTMTCECSCNGRNHGKGAALICEPVGTLL